MQIESISLVNFRNYENLDLVFSPQLNIIYGDNGSGKTNLVEAIYMLSLTRSFRVNNDKLVIKKGKIKAKIGAKIKSRDMFEDYYLEVSNQGKRIVVDNNNIEKVSDYVTRLNVVLFNPADTRIMEGLPEVRRKLINIMISQVYKEYLIVLAKYQKILKQRNFYLRGMYVNNNYVSTYLDILTKKLIEYGMILANYRENYIKRINEYITDIYESIFNSGVLKIKYVSVFKNKNSEELFKRYKNSYQNELKAGKTLEGIHHDDIVFVLDDNELKSYGSEGQKKNAVIAMKLAMVKVIKDIKGKYPILILDDLFSELDKKKINNLLGVIDSEVQTFITTCNISLVSKSKRKNAKIFKVEDGIMKEEV